MDNKCLILYRTLKDESEIRLKIRDLYNYKVVPVPVEISIKCGIGHEISKEDFNNIYNVILNYSNDNNIDMSSFAFYNINNNGYSVIEV